MTGLSAANFGLTDRGEIRVGAFADLVLFDLEALEDIATYTAPIARASGIERVIVNGVVSYRQGEASEYRAGRLLRRRTRLSAEPSRTAS